MVLRRELVEASKEIVQHLDQLLGAALTRESLGKIGRWNELSF